MRARYWCSETPRGGLFHWVERGLYSGDECIQRALRDLGCIDVNTCCHIEHVIGQRIASDQRNDQVRVRVRLLELCFSEPAKFIS